MKEANSLQTPGNSILSMSNTEHSVVRYGPGYLGTGAGGVGKGRRPTADTERRRVEIPAP